MRSAESVPRWLPGVLEVFDETAQPGRMVHTTVLHDEWCRLLVGKGPCNCNPVVRPGKPEEQR